jgi:hypothetical protein
VTGSGTFDLRRSDPRLTPPCRQRRRLVAAKPISPPPTSLGFAHIPRPHVEAKLGERVKQANKIDTPDAPKIPRGMWSQICFFCQKAALDIKHSDAGAMGLHCNICLWQPIKPPLSHTPPVVPNKGGATSATWAARSYLPPHRRAGIYDANAVAAKIAVAEIKRGLGNVGLTKPIPREDALLAAPLPHQRPTRIVAP